MARMPMFNFFSHHEQNPLNTKDPLDAIIEIESRGKANAIGDKHLANKAYGPLQIRKPVLDDVNNFYGTNYETKDVMNNIPLSKDIFKKYTDIYATSSRIGRNPTLEDRARIWNGGPNGFRNDNTKQYWNRVKENL